MGLQSALSSSYTNLWQSMLPTSSAGVLHIGEDEDDGEDVHGLDDTDDAELIDGTHIKTPIYFIRHGEKPKDGGKYLSAMGQKRAQCLRDVFGSQGGKKKHRSKSDRVYDVGYILAQDFDKVEGTRRRPYDTVKPLAKDLHLRVDHHCDRDDTRCVIRAIKAFDMAERQRVAMEEKQDADADAADAAVAASSQGPARMQRKKRRRRRHSGILVCWEHKRLKKISRALGDKFKYPSHRYDLVFEMLDGKVTENSPFSERCEALDD
ncbi:unnamed protein product [Parajaminaea phylloscopi]